MARPGHPGAVHRREALGFKCYLTSNLIAPNMALTPWVGYRVAIEMPAPDRGGRTSKHPPVNALKVADDSV